MSITTPTAHRAVKRHQCDLCGEPVLTGSIYTRWRFFNGADVGTVKVHPACETEAEDYDWYSGEWPGEYPLAEEREQAGGVQ